MSKIIWESERSVSKAPKPPPELGYDLLTLADVRKWLSHPSNWHKSNFQHLIFVGRIPTISEHMAQRLINFPEEANFFYQVVLREHRYIKEGNVRPEDDDGQLTEEETEP